MRWNQVLGVAAAICAFGRGARADERPPVSDSIERAVQQAPRAKRVVHTDYAALSAGAILFGVGYAMALSVPVQKNFGDNSGHLAIPLVGPWLSAPSWGWALDGLMQLGGAAFMVDAYANPITVLGTPEAQLRAPAPGQHLLRMTLRF
jgi:hypothetical protein